MRMIHTCALLVIGAAMFAAVACAGDPQNAPVRSAAPVDAPTIERVGAGDELEITIFAGGELQEQSSGVVAADGRVPCPLLGSFPAAGRGVDEIAADLQARLARDYFQSPRVTVSVKTYGATISVTGEVRRPGVYRLHEAPTALAACVLAGGFTDFASARGARLVRVRGGKPEIVRVDLARVKQGRIEDVPLEPGDRLDIPRRML